MVLSIVPEVIYAFNVIFFKTWLLEELLQIFARVVQVKMIFHFLFTKLFLDKDQFPGY